MLKRPTASWTILLVEMGKFKQDKQLGKLRLYFSIYYTIALKNMNMLDFNFKFWALSYGIFIFWFHFHCTAEYILKGMLYQVKISYMYKVYSSTDFTL